MSTYLIGDVHGCYDELKSLLAQAAFDPEHDRLWLTGDLVARGPASLDVLRFVRSLGPAVRMVLGNHDLHLLAVYAGISRNKPKDRITPLLEAPDADELINWLRRQPVLQVDDEQKLVMAHAGITPQWDIDTAKMCAREVEAVLSSDSYPLFRRHVRRHAEQLDTGTERPGAPAFQHQCAHAHALLLPQRPARHDLQRCAGTAPAPLKPWFELPRLVDPEYTIVFGHWASLEGKGTPEGVIGLDTGCCWGGDLTMLRWEDRRYFTQPANRGEAPDHAGRLAAS